MAKSFPEKIVSSVSIDMLEQSARIEKLSSPGAGGGVNIRISAQKKGGSRAGPLTLSEEQLIDLLYRASHAGVLSQGFIGKLRAKIEI